MKRNPFSIKKRIQSFKYAFYGLKVLIVEEHNARIHFVVTIVVFAFGWYFKINRLEWIALLICIGLVVAVEAINSAIENLADFVCTEPHPTIKKIKDLSAAAVLVAALTALLVGLLVFVPKLLSIF